MGAEDHPAFDRVEFLVDLTRKAKDRLKQAKGNTSRLAALVVWIDEQLAELRPKPVAPLVPADEGGARPPPLEIVRSAGLRIGGAAQTASLIAGRLSTDQARDLDKQAVGLAGVEWVERTWRLIGKAKQLCPTEAQTGRFLFALMRELDSRDGLPATPVAPVLAAAAAPSRALPSSGFTSDPEDENEPSGIERALPRGDREDDS